MALSIEQVSEKQCSLCKNSLPLSSFNKRKTGTLLLSSQCKHCIALRVHERTQTYASSKQKLLTVGIKKCSICKENKAYVEFYLNKNSKDLLTSQCKDCISVKSTIYRNLPGKKKAKRISQIRWNEKNKHKATHRRARQYGISGDEYNTMLEEQGMACAICKKTDPGYKAFNIDHDHATGKVRGILCNPCNMMLGQIGDNMETLHNAILYLSSQENLLSLVGDVAC